MDDDVSAGVTKYQNGLGIDDKLSLQTGGVRKYFLQDHLGSTVALTNSSGVATEQTSYDSFGNRASNLSTRYQYTGRGYDSFAGFYYYSARWYDANLGRFVSEDPFGFEGGELLLSGYAYNDPANFYDSSGMFPTKFKYPKKGTLPGTISRTEWICDILEESSATDLRG